MLDKGGEKGGEQRAAPSLWTSVFMLSLLLLSLAKKRWWCWFVRGSGVVHWHDSFAAQKDANIIPTKTTVTRRRHSWFCFWEVFLPFDVSFCLPYVSAHVLAWKMKTIRRSSLFRHFDCWLMWTFPHYLDSVHFRNTIVGRSNTTHCCFRSTFLFCVGCYCGCGLVGRNR